MSSKTREYNNKRGIWNKINNTLLFVIINNTFTYTIYI